MNQVLSWGYLNLYDVTNELFVIDSTDLQLLGYTNTGRANAFSVDGAYYASVGYSDDTRFKLGLFNTDDWTHVAGNPLSIAAPSPFWQLGTFYHCAFSADNNYFAYTFSNSPYFKVLDLNNDYAEIENIPQMTSAATGSGFVQFSPDQTWMAVTNPGGDSLTIWTVSNWQKVSSTPTFSTTLAPNLAFSANSVWLAIVCDTAPYLSIYTTSNWTIVAGTPSLTVKAQCCAFSPNGTYLAVGGYDELKIYTTADWNPVAISFPIDNLATNDDIQQVAFSPDGAWLATVFVPLPINGVPQRRLLVFNTTTWTVQVDTSIDSSNMLGLSWSSTEIIYQISGIVSDYGANDVLLLSLPKDSWERLGNQTISGIINYAGLVERQQFTKALGAYKFSYLYNRERDIIAINMTDIKAPLILGNILPE